jgi:toxin ParE1/3/4
MAFQIVWSPEAAQDLQEIVRFIGRDSIEYAATWAARLVERIETLEQFPRLGPRVWHLLAGELRKLTEGSYLIIYRVRGTQVHILAIVHGARQWRRVVRTRGRT